MRYSIVMSEESRFVLARIEKAGKRFEISVDAERAFAFRSKCNVPIDDVLRYPAIYTDAGRGDEAPHEELRKVFGTDDPVEIAKTILKKGELHLTTEQRRKMSDERRREIASLISREAVDPRTGAPYTQQMILNAMDSAKVRTDPFRTASEQAEEAMKSLRPVIPIKSGKMQINIRVPAKFGSALSGRLRKFGRVLKESWGSEYSALIEISSGLENELYSLINSLTRGEAKAEVVRKE